MASSEHLNPRLENFISVQHVIIMPIATLTVLFLLYGFYIIVFGVSIHILTRRDSSASKLYLVGTIALFVLSTIFVVIEFWGNLRQCIIYFNIVKTGDYTALSNYLDHDTGKTTWTFFENVINVLLNAIADWMLIYRCYVVWDFNRFVLYILTFIAVVLNGMNLGTTVAGLIGIIDTASASNLKLYQTNLNINNGCNIAIVGLQLLLAFMTGGRIWWISFQARKSIGKPPHQQLQSVVIIIIESGVLVAATLLVNTIFDYVVDSSDQGRLPFKFADINTLMWAIAPTLIIVRVAYGKSINNVNQVISTMHFVDRPIDQESTSAAVTDREAETKPEMPSQLNPHVQ